MTYHTGECFEGSFLEQQENKHLTWKRGRFWNSSPRMQPQDQTSIAGPYLSSPNKSSGGRYHNVITLFV